MIKEVPDDQEHLIARLKKMQMRSLYFSPEAQTRLWALTGVELTDNLPDPSELNAWQQNVADIFSAKLTFKQDSRPCPHCYVPPPLEFSLGSTLLGRLVLIAKTRLLGVTT